jgi:hypothetical protein
MPSSLPLAPRASSPLLVVVALLGCDADASGTDGAGGSAATTSTAAAGQPPTSATTSSSTMVASSSSTGVFSGLGTLGTLVVLGDSIGSGGGRPPFYPNVLRQQLEAKYGALAFYNHASSGSTTAALASQIDELPDELPSPVAVVITSGANDLQAALPLVLEGTDQPARDAMSARIGDALDQLLAPARFGSEVEVFVFEANIYDASDGSGDLGPVCGYGEIRPLPIVRILDAWNAAILAPVTARGQSPMDIRGLFAGHGLESAAPWFVDCGHPNATGHAMLAEYFAGAITGE